MLILTTLLKEKRILLGLPATTALLISNGTCTNSIHGVCAAFQPCTSPYAKRSFYTRQQAFSSTQSEDGELSISNVPLVFVPGMKGTHLAYLEDKSKGTAFKTKTLVGDNVRPIVDKLKFSSWFKDFQENDNSTSGIENNIKEYGGKKRKVWLTLPGLLNLPPLPEDHPDRSLALPLTYTNGIQDKGHLFPDGIIRHVVELGKTVGPPLEFFPFYGHVVKHLEEMDAIYNEQKQSSEHIDKRINQIRPTATFEYDWRRPISELSTEFHEFCNKKFPNQPVQVVSHSLGGLISFAAMREDPEKFKPGGVFVGVPFGTGIQYLEDLHRGYYTELNRCRQFTPKDQFTFSSHWIFFPMEKQEVGDSLLDVSDEEDILFEADKSSIGKASNDISFKLSDAKGKEIEVDFHSVKDWEDLEIGIFDPIHRERMDEETIKAYKDHMKIQLQEAKKWRQTVLMEKVDKNALPNLIICATDSIPTVNQILRRKRKPNDIDDKKASRVMKIRYYDDPEVQHSTQSSWEYDYINGRRVPGDGRIDFDKAFPELDLNMKKVRLGSLHAKQMCWEDNGGDWGKIWNEVRTQLQEYQADDIAKGQNLGFEELINLN